jgi:predicted alpha/beta-fold hydrolase
MSADFRPLPLLHNGHLQTLLGFWLPGERVHRHPREQVLPLLDGDALMLYDNIPTGWQPERPVAVVVHGLSGSHASACVHRMAAQLLRRQVRVVRLDLRGAGKGVWLARGCYHAGRSEDIRAVLEEVRRWAPESPLLLVGLSLGGALALRLASEAASRPVAGLARIAAVGPPIDLERCAALLGRSYNRIYESAFVRDLVADVHRRHRHFTDLPPVRFPARLTVRGFDDLYTAPRSGFAGAADYYCRASVLPLLHRIEVPTLVLTARDDPFIAVEPFEEAAFSPAVEVHILQHGGHLGYVGWDGAGGIRWGERRMVEWLLSP